MPESESVRKTPPGLPHSLEAEQALLGALLFDNRLWERLPLLTPGMFYDPVHGRIFQAIAEKIRAGLLADGVSLREWARADPGIAEIGVTYLMKLMESAAPLPTQAQSYAELIRYHYQRREVYGACKRLAASALLADVDIADAIRTGERELGALIAGGRNWISVREAGEGIVESLGEEAPRGIRTGLAKLDRILGGGLYAPDLVIIAGRPAMGKTALADNISTNVADSQRVVGSFSMEMDPDQIAARVLSRRSSAIGQAFSYTDLRNPHRRPAQENVRSLLSYLPDTLLIDPTGAQTLSAIEASARNMKREMGQLDLILVDYLQLMRDTQSRKGNRTEELSEITAGLKTLAKRLHCPVVALSQLSRAVENRADKRPQLADLRESGSIEQDADIVVFVYREHYYLERNEPVRGETETKAEFATRAIAHENRKAEVANTFDLFTGKNRHGPGGSETLFCDLAMDVISDDRPPRTPHASTLRQDVSS